MGLFCGGGNSLPGAGVQARERRDVPLKTLLVSLLALLVALTACAAAEEAAPTQTVAQGDGYALTFDAAAFAFYRDGVVAGTDLLVPTQDVVSPVYMLVSRVEDMEAEAASFAGEGYADGGEIALLSGQTARVFTLQRADVDYVAYLVEGEGAAFTLLTVCSTQAEDYALRLREVVDTFTLTPQSEAA